MQKQWSAFITQLLGTKNLLPQNVDAHLSYNVAALNFSRFSGYLKLESVGSLFELTRAGLLMPAMCCEVTFWEITWLQPHLQFMLVMNKWGPAHPHYGIVSACFSQMKRSDSFVRAIGKAWQLKLMVVSGVQTAGCRTASSKVDSELCSEETFSTSKLDASTCKSLLLHLLYFFQCVLE